MGVFRKGDCNIQSVLAVVLGGHLAATTQLKFQNAFAENAFAKIFDLDKMAGHDKKEVSAFKILELRMLFNNMDLTDYIPMVAPGQLFTAHGMQAELDLEVKMFC